ncbi:MAG: hypothetical protein AAB727_03175 [Patescibacteria group bacterium]
MTREQSAVLEKLCRLATVVRAQTSARISDPVYGIPYTVIEEALATLNWAFDRAPRLEEVVAYIVDHGDENRVQEIIKIRAAYRHDPGALRTYFKKQYHIPKQPPWWRRIVSFRTYAAS